MITTEGEVVGVNTAVIQGAQGLSFSVDINTAKEIAHQLITTGKVFKAWLGIMMQEVPINPKVKQHYNLQNRKGLFVTRIESDSPATRSQLLEGDIIISFNDKTIHSTHDLFKELTRKDIMTMTNITVIRYSELLHFSISPMEKLVDVKNG
jgi:S1-C subfamily serine protease